MIFNTDKIRGRIVEIYGSLTNFCSKTDYSYSTLQGKLSSKTYFNQSEIMKFIEWLRLDDEDIVRYFFTLRV